MAANRRQPIRQAILGDRLGDLAAGMFGVGNVDGCTVHDGRKHRRNADRAGRCSFSGTRTGFVGRHRSSAFGQLSQQLRLINRVAQYVCRTQRIGLDHSEAMLSTRVMSAATMTASTSLRWLSVLPRMSDVTVHFRSSIPLKADSLVRVSAMA